MHNGVIWNASDSSGNAIAAQPDSARPSLPLQPGGDPVRRISRIYWVCAVLIGLGSVALLSTAVKGTLLSDDWDHYAMQQHIYPVKVPAWDMFRFVGDSVQERQALLNAGRLPWWASEDLELAVFRPLSSLLVYVDFAWLGGKQHPGVLHAHSLLWWAVLFGAVAALYRRFLSLPIALLSLLLFAVDDAHVYPVVWLANRSEVVSVAFVCWAIWAHLAAETAQRSHALRTLALAFTALGLLAGEHAIAPLCYLIAIELFGSRRAVRHRIGRLAPYLALVGLYLIWRASLGYGVAGSAFYVDPFSEPARYLQTAATRVPLLFGDSIFGMAAEWWYWGVPWAHYLQGVLPKECLTVGALQSVQVVLGGVSLVVCIACLGWMFPRTSGDVRHRRCWAIFLGSLISLIPLSGTASMTRLTVVPVIAVDAALGAVLLWLLRRTVGASAWSMRLSSGTAALIVLWLHLVRAIYISVQGSLYLTNTSHLQYGWATSADFGDRDLRGRHAIIVSAHDMASQYLLPYLLHAARLPMPLSSHLLSPAADNDHILTRIASNVLDIQFPEPIKNPAFAPMVYRPSDPGFSAGQTFRNSLFEVQVKSIRGSQPRHLRFTFHHNLDDERYVFVYPTKRGMEELMLPSQGTSIRLDAPAWPQ